MTDIYTVATRLVLEDQGMIAGIERLVKVLRELDEMLDKSRGSMRGMFNSALASRAAKFADSLKILNTEARDLDRTMERLGERRLNNLRAGSAGGGGSGGGGGHGTSGHGPFGSAWHGAMRAINTYYDAQMVGEMVGSVFEPGVRLSHEEYAARQQGISAADVERMRLAAFATARQVPSTSANDIFKSERELYPLAMMGLRPGESAVDHMLAHLQDAISTDALVGRFMGGEKGSHVSEYWNAMRAGESLGFSGDKLREFTGDTIRSIIASGGRINAEQIRQVVQKGGATAIALDPNFLLKAAPELILEQGGSAVGTMLATFARSAAGRMTLQSAEEQAKLGLIKPGALTVNHGHPVVAEGGFVGEQERYANPTQYAIDYLAPALLRHMGVNTTGMTHDQIAQRISAQGLNQEEKVKLITELNRLFSDRNAARGAEQFMLQAQQIERFFRLYDQTNPGTIDNMRANDATGALDGVRKAWDTLLTGLTADKVQQAIPGINMLADAMTWLGQQAQKHPRYAGVTEMGLGFGGAGLAGYAGIRFLMAGPALTGAAAALTRSAAALSAAAERQGLPGGGPGGLPTGGGGKLSGIGWGRWLATGAVWCGLATQMSAAGVGTPAYDGHPLLSSVFGLATGQGDTHDSWLWNKLTGQHGTASSWLSGLLGGGGGTHDALRENAAHISESARSDAEHVIAAIRSLPAAIRGAISSAIEHESARPPADPAGVDPRLNPLFPAFTF